MKQTTNSILMIRPVAFRMNEQTAVNNYYQKVLNDLLPSTVNARAQQEFDIFVDKLRAVGVEVTVIDDIAERDRTVIIPVVLAYQAHAYWIFRGKVQHEADGAHGGYG